VIVKDKNTILKHGRIQPMKKTAVAVKSAMTLENVIRVNLRRYRKMLGYTHKQMADFVGLKRSSYTKKETGETAILIRDIEVLSKKLNLTVSELMKGYNNLGIASNSGGLNAAAQEKYPPLKNVVDQANVAAESNLQADNSFLLQTLEHAKNKIEEEQKG
jgi:transcriptional regulator with XRE-family HTH domain